MGLNERDVLRRLKGRNIELVGAWKGPVDTEHTFRCTAPLGHPDWTVPARRVLVDGVGCPRCGSGTNMLATKTVQARLAKKGLRLEGEWATAFGRYTVHCTAGLGHEVMHRSGHAILRPEIECPKCAALRKAARALRHPRRPRRQHRRRGGRPSTLGI